MSAEIDQKLGEQLDDILHHKDFQTLESAWRGLKFVVDRTDFRENIKIELLDVSKQDLLDDFFSFPRGAKETKERRLCLLGRSASCNTDRIQDEKSYFLKK